MRIFCHLGKFLYLGAIPFQVREEDETSTGTELDLAHIWQKSFKACDKLMIINNDYTAHLNISHYQFITNLKLKT